MDKKSTTVGDYWQHYAEIMNARFNLIKTQFTHPGNKGSHGEIILREFLREYLPNDFLIGHGEVIDSDDNRSGQIDIVVANKSLQPFVYNHDIPNTFIIEAVTCIGEVKFKINSIEEFIEQSSIIKSLTSKSRHGDMIHTNKSDMERFYKKRPFFVFAYSSSITIETIIDKLNNQTSPVIEQIDAIFILDSGVIINFGDGSGAFKYKDQNNNPGIKYIYVSEEKEVLKTFITWLTCIMPKIICFESPILNYIIHTNKRPMVSIP